jgi:hypothetical protein
MPSPRCSWGWAWATAAVANEIIAAKMTAQGVDVEWRDMGCSPVWVGFATVDVNGIR